MDEIYIYTVGGKHFDIVSEKDLIVIWGNILDHEVVDIFVAVYPDDLCMLWSNDLMILILTILMINLIFKF